MDMVMSAAMIPEGKITSGSVHDAEAFFRSLSLMAKRDAMKKHSAKIAIFIRCLMVGFIAMPLS
jgi:hypothetical protein